ncbi:MAG: TIGR04282 family arsenosugar biosynthesis glycosyltransferase [Bacteroidota bacterium]
MSIILPKQNKQDKKTIHYQKAIPKELLLIFTRNPELGKCKTRLAATIGDVSALEIYTFLLAHTAKITQNLPGTKKVYYSEEVWEKDVWDLAFFEKAVQTGADLGERMANAFLEGFASGFQKIVIIGSDMYDLSQSDLEHAFLCLENSDFVIGPAADGGYYLLGMKHFNPVLFQNKQWGKSTVFGDTMENLTNESTQVLPIKNDIDVYDDIKEIEVFKPFLKNP